METADKKIYLIFSDGNNKISRTLMEGQRLVIGRCVKPGDFTESYKICLKYDDYVEKIGIMDGTVSKEHAEIFWENKVPYIRDLGSRNGTKIDGCLIPGWKRGGISMAVPLRKGAKLLLGSFTYVSVEIKEKTLTITKGDTIRLPHDDIKKLLEFIRIRDVVDEKVKVVQDVKKEGTVKTKDKTSVNISADQSYLIISKFLMTGYHLRDLIREHKTLNAVRKEWNALCTHKPPLSKMENICDAFSKFYHEMGMWIEECNKFGDIPDEIRRHMLRLLEEILRIAEEVLGCHWRSRDSQTSD